MTEQQPTTSSVDSTETLSRTDEPAERGFGMASQCPRTSLAGKLPMDRGNLLLAALFAAGIMTVYLLSRHDGPAKASAAQSQTETRVNSVLTALSQNSRAAKADEERDVTDVFYYEARRRQIPIAMLPRNPFVFQPPPSRSPRRPEEKASDDAEKQRQREFKELSQAMETVKGLRLQSVLDGSGGRTAMINNNLLTEGQVIRGWVVDEIRPGEVVMRWRRHTYVLKMAE